MVPDLRKVRYLVSSGSRDANPSTPSPLTSRCRSEDDTTANARQNALRGNQGRDAVTEGSRQQTDNAQGDAYAGYDPRAKEFARPASKETSRYQQCIVGRSDERDGLSGQTNSQSSFRPGGRAGKCVPSQMIAERRRSDSVLDRLRRNSQFPSKWSSRGSSRQRSYGNSTTCQLELPIAQSVTRDTHSHAFQPPSIVSPSTSSSTFSISSFFGLRSSCFGDPV